MASAQVLPNSATASRKQEHLEAGKRRLEEFRKKKAADRAKKATSTSRLPTVEVVSNEKPLSETDLVRITDSEGAVTSDGVPSGVVTNNDNQTVESIQSNKISYSYGTRASLPLPADHHNSFSVETVQKLAKNQEFNKDIASESAEPVNVNYSSQTRVKNDDYGFINGTSGRLEFATDLHSKAVRDIDNNSSLYSHYGSEGILAKDTDNHMKNFSVINPESSLEVGQNMNGILESNNTMSTDMEGKKLSSSVGHLPSVNSTPLWSSGSQSTGFRSDARSSSSSVPPYPPVAENYPRRSHPSFLDSINLPRISSISLPITAPEKAGSFSSKIPSSDVQTSSALEMSFTETQTVEPFSKLRTSNASSAFEHPTIFSASDGNPDILFGYSVNGNKMESKHDFYLQKQDENFATLEQHIEDLTQEKFSLQRALEASRALAESLAGENSALTDSYNQQGSVVNQLKSDMEKLQAEIRAQLVELESLKIEYANAQLECNAADERAKLLASEVIGLEDKALRLRSSELKLERQLEKSEIEISSFKKKMSSLEKECQDLQSTIDALQEEKKLLQAKLRKASINDSKIPNKKDTSTSTEDLVYEDGADSTPVTSNVEVHSNTSLIGSNALNYMLLPENRLFNLEVSSLSIPPDQMRMIQNIGTLISELALEKEVMVQALQAESSESSKLKEVNKELSQRLEGQTQKLELLTAQTMANGNVQVRQQDTQMTHDSTAYADEGDEVVERVLGWIMKLFPGGPSRRRTSKLL